MLCQTLLLLHFLYCRVSTYLCHNLSMFTIVVISTLTIVLYNILVKLLIRLLIEWIPFTKHCSHI